MGENIKQAIIFDMDNTLLRSAIDFPKMRKVTYDFLVKYGFSPEDNQPTSVMLQSAAKNPAYTPDLDAEIWAQINEIEKVGMENAVLEPGVVSSMSYLAQHFTLMIFTNNLQRNVTNVLAEFGLAPYFFAVAGRDKVANLKPKPDGYLYLLGLCPGLEAKKCLAVGDASIDLLAANAISMPFVAYNNSRPEDWSPYSPKPLAFLHQWDIDACKTIENIMDKL